MFRKVMVVYMVFAFANLGVGQKDKQVMVHENPFGDRGLYYPTYRFEADFKRSDYFSFSKGNSTFYSDRKVRRIEVFNSNDVLVYHCLLDVLGQVIEEGIKGVKYYIHYKTDTLDEGSFRQVLHYYKEKALIRVDTVVRLSDHYVKEDTVLGIYLNREKDYRVGHLINKQNRYFNQKYCNRKVERSPFFFQFSITGEEVDHDSIVYFKTPFRTDYDSLTLYPYRFVNNDSWSHQKGDTVLPWNHVKEHPFFILYDLPFMSKYFCEGADFDEPSFMREKMWCGNSIYSEQHFYDGRSYGYTRLENDLYDTYYLDYYPIDPNPKPVVRDTSQNNPFAAFVNIDNQGPQRLSTPERSTLYQYRYTYFE